MEIYKIAKEMDGEKVVLSQTINPPNTLTKKMMFLKDQLKALLQRKNVPNVISTPNGIVTNSGSFIFLENGILINRSFIVPYEKWKPEAYEDLIVRAALGQ